MQPKLDVVVLRDLLLEWDVDGDAEYSLLPDTRSSLRCDHAVAQTLLRYMLQASAFGIQGKEYVVETANDQNVAALAALCKNGIIVGDMDKGFTVTAQGMQQLCCQNIFAQLEVFVASSDLR